MTEERMILGALDRILKNANYQFEKRIDGEGKTYYRLHTESGINAVGLPGLFLDAVNDAERNNVELEEAFEVRNMILTPMFLIFDESSSYIFLTYDKPLPSEFSGSVENIYIENIESFDSFDEWPDGSDAPDECIGRHRQKRNCIRIFESESECKKAGYEYLGPNFDIVDKLPDLLSTRRQ